MVDGAGGRREVRAAGGARDDEQLLAAAARLCVSDFAPAKLGRRAASPGAGEHGDQTRLFFARLAELHGYVRSLLCLRGGVRENWARAIKDARAPAPLQVRHGARLSARIQGAKNNEARCSRAETDCIGRTGPPGMTVA